MVCLTFTHAHSRTAPSAEGLSALILSVAVTAIGIAGCSSMLADDENGVQERYLKLDNMGT